jgi:hypothetical protein
LTEHGEERCLVIERDNNTGATRRLDNMATDPWGDTFTRPEAEASVKWREEHISRKYSYEIRPVTGWVLEIGPGVHHDLFMAALNTKFREEDPYESPTVRVRPDGKPGGQVWAYTRKGVSHPPAWLVGLCAFFEDEQRPDGGYPPALVTREGER